MGQYYHPVIEIGDKIEAYSTHLDREYVMAKLMEHSWFENDFVNAIAHKIYLEPHRVAWIGDYADDVIEDFPNVPVQELYRTAWIGKQVKEDLKSVDFTLDNKFLVNHDLKEYISLNDYRKENTSDGWCTNPLSLLTAIGNGQGGGDFYIADKEQVQNVGIWAWNTLEITDDAPNDYKKVMYHFIEE